MTSVLEQRYRSLLRILPPGYRAEWEEEMVATFLEGMLSPRPGEDRDEAAERAAYVADCGRPGWDEVTSVAGLAVRLRLPTMRYRLGGAQSPPRYRAWGDAVRLLGLLGLLVSASLAIVAAGHRLWVTGRVPGLPAPLGDPGYSTLDTWSAVALALECAAVPAYLAMVTGHRQVGRLLAVIPVGTAALGSMLSLGSAASFGTAAACRTALDVVLLAALWAYTRDVPPLRRGTWLAALPAGVAVTLAVVLVTQRTGERWWPLLDWPALTCVVIALADAVCLGIAALRRARPPLRWSLGLALLTLALVAQRLLTLSDQFATSPSSQHRAIGTAAFAEVAVALALGVPLMLLARDGLHRLPAPPPAPTRSTPSPRRA